VVRTVSHFKLTIGGKESAGLSPKASPTFQEWPEREAIEHALGAGKKRRRLDKPGHITLRRGIDNNAELWKWRDQVQEGDVEGARVDSTIEIVDEGGSVAVYTLWQSWPTKYHGVKAVAGSEASIEQIEIAYEAIERL
jgi:phage tail-like protein